MKQALAFVYLTFGGILITSAITGESVGELLTKGITPAGKQKLHAEQSPSGAGEAPGSSGGGGAPGSSGGGGGSGGGSIGGASGPPSGLPPSPSKIQIPKSRGGLDFNRLTELIHKGGPKGHLTPNGVKEILNGKVTLEKAEKELGVK